MSLTTLITIIVAVIFILSVAFVYFIYQLRRIPRNNPVAFLKKNRRIPDKQVVVCAGASIVQGSVSFNFVDYLERTLSDKGYQFINAGINGNLAYDLLNRLDPIIECRPDFVTILVGTNDANASLTETSIKRARQLYKLPCDPSLDWYRENITGIVTRLKDETSATIALISLPVLGSDLQSPSNQNIIACNNILRQVAAEQGIAYLPLHEQHEAFLREHQESPVVTYDGSVAWALKAALQHHMLGMSLDKISQSNGLLLTSDCVHMNTRGGMMIVDLVSDFLT